MTYKCKHFAIHELVPPEVYIQRGEKAWELMDERILQTIDRLRDRFGPATINNYEFGGNRKWSGLRTPDSPWFSPYSQHTFGRAVDVVFRDVTAEEVRFFIKDYTETCESLDTWPEDTGYIKAVEEDVSWLHIDCRNVQPIKWFNP